MKIAILDSDVAFVNDLKSKLSIRDWHITVVDSNNKDCSMYDAVLIGESVDKKQLDCDADFALIGKPSEEVVQDDSINAIIDKDDIEEIIDWLKYVDAKLRIKRNTEIKINLKKVIITTDLPLIKVSDFTVGEKQKAFDKAKECDFKCIVYFDENLKTLYSVHLNQLIILWKHIVKDNSGKMVLWKAGRNGEIDEKFKLCRLDALIPYFDKLDDAANYVK